MVEFRKEDTWTDGKYEYERLPRHRLPPREIPPDGEYQRMVNIVQKRPPDEEGYNRYEDYSDSEFRDYEECYANERKSGFPYRDDPAYRWRGEPHMSRQLEYRESKDAYKKKPYYHPNICPRERSPHRRDSPFVRDSPVTRKDSPHSRSGSSVSSRSYSPERGKSYPFHQHRRSKEQSCTHPSAVSPTSSAAIPPTKGAELDKSSRLSDPVFMEAACKWVAERMEKVTESKLQDCTEEHAGSSSALHGDQIAELEANVSGNSEFHDANPHTSRSRAIAAKTKEIEEVYRQDCETFGMVVKMLIDKDSTLEKQIQFSLRQNLSEIGERCIEELKMYITEYDAHQELV
ncbi:periphilin 1 S homeolog isoform X1 [Xenopus laevis]|uniref:Periphilin 1 S homeolog isoform X1 n=1 Tax=Xenopus laevis TaxID=8355 RepID=A0A8J1MR97_XENLA|nr:periphilin 1 S homeolog isoform X1 [Xenopus laevis]